MRLDPADHELTDSEILDRFGPLLVEAVEAFRQDPTYVVEAVEGHAKILRQREKRRAARESDTRA